MTLSSAPFCHVTASLRRHHHQKATKIHLPKHSRFLTSTHTYTTLQTRVSDSDTQLSPQQPPSEIDCVGTGTDVECVYPSDGTGEYGITEPETTSLRDLIWEWTLLVSPFFFWGTAMVAMKEVLPKTGPLFVSSFRLIPSGLLLVAFAASRGRKVPSGLNAWFSIALFAIVDATCFQGFLAKGLEKTSAGLGSVIIDSQPLTVAVLASLLFGESISLVGVAGLILGVVGLALLEVPAISFDENNFSLWGSGEWWMLLAAQSMAVGTVMVRWVSKYSDPVMATGWHMVLGGIPLAAVSVLVHDPALSGGLNELTANDLFALLYTSVFGSAISYGLYFYNATRGSLTKLSSLTFLTPMFASLFGFLYLGETFSPVQLAGALVTVGAIYMVNYKDAVE
ncbi:WAT1-related protein At3g02690, chloroplastic-like [Bidens hawaiensis]|uniref:WAT1-related protein At3g02690, chloroplastic-like n=1 Tax=Bidens hawaiensis TaxID=980011 RepID=UPI0040499FA4